MFNTIVCSDLIYESTAGSEGQSYTLSYLPIRPGFIKVLFIYLFIYLERGSEGEKWRETSIHQTSIYQLPLVRSPTVDLAPNPGMWPDQESNWWPSVCRMTPNPLSHTSQDKASFMSILQSRRPKSSEIKFAHNRTAGQCRSRDLKGIRPGQGTNCPTLCLVGFVSLAINV